MRCACSHGKASRRQDCGAYTQLRERIDALLELDFEVMPSASLRIALEAIGRRD